MSSCARVSYDSFAIPRVRGHRRWPALPRDGGGLGAVYKLTTPEAGLLGQGVRFATAGGVVAVVYLGVTTVLATLLGTPFQLALAIGFCVGLAVHFTLQRTFVWTHHEEFALPLRHQAGRYAIAAAAQYGVTAASTSQLPPLLGLSPEVVYLATVPIVVGANFLVFRHGIFHARSTAADSR